MSMPLLDCAHARVVGQVSPRLLCVLDPLFYVVIVAHDDDVTFHHGSLWITRVLFWQTNISTHVYDPEPVLWSTREHGR